MAISPSRFIAVLLGLAGLGFICGAVLGAVVSVIETTAHYGFPSQALGPVLGFGAIFGAPIGAFITPIVGFVFARRAPLWKAIAAGAVGALLGAIAVTPLPIMGILGALPGFLLALFVLFWQTTRGARTVSTAA